MDMRIQIDKSEPLKNIQAQFSQVFPFLKIEFFKTPHKARKIAPSTDIIKPDEPAARYSTVPGTVDINIDQEMTVETLEDEFYKKAGLSVQVYRKSGNVWIQTSLTDDWTLQQQNKEGEIITSHFKA